MPKTSGSPTKELERQKYEAVWTNDFYRTQADGDPVVEIAFKAMGCKPGEKLVDWGCGKGTPAARFRDLGLQVIGFDIANNCLDPGVEIPLVVGCLWDPPSLPSLCGDYAFCTDVLEHIPPAHLDEALDVITARTSKAAFLQVCTTHDTAGRRMAPPQVLHLSVYSAGQWANMIRLRWRKVEMFTRGKSRAYFVCFK